MEVLVFKSSDEELWRLIGRYGFDPKIRKELGGPMSSYEDTVWFVAVDNEFADMGRRDVAGFAALKVDKRMLAHCYVFPQYRGRGLAARLTEARIAKAKELGLGKVNVILGEKAGGIYGRKYGFYRRLTRGKWGTYTLEVEP